jgi:hypothetical protein
MNRLKQLVPSPAMAVAVVSLFVALGGVGYAAATIGSAQIKNNSIRGKDIKNRTIGSKDIKKNGLGGTNIKESKLGKVPSASTADAAGTAGTAGNAATVGGLPPGSLVRVARANKNELASAGVSGSRVVVSTKITAPTAGWLTITAGSDVVGIFGDDTFACWLTVGGTEIDASERTIQLNPGSSPTSNQEENCNTNATVPVAAGVKTVALVADPFQGGTVFDETALTAIFSPYGPDGKQPSTFNLNSKSGPAGSTDHTNR